MKRRNGLLVAAVLGLTALASGCKDNGLFDRNEGPVEETREGIKEQSEKAKEGAKDLPKDDGLGGSGKEEKGRPGKP